MNPTGSRKIYRYQVQGPTALEVLEKVTGGPLPEIKFFNMGELTIAGHQVRALHHGMSGVPGLELFGPLGRRRGRRERRSSRRARSSGCARSAPGSTRPTRSSRAGSRARCRPIFTGDELKAYREWLPADGYEGTGSLGGSFYSDDIADYYLTPYDLGYGPLVKFDHDFVGREALEKMAANPTAEEGHARLERRRCRRARWGRCSRKEDRAKYIDLPLSNYSTWPNDKVLKDGKMVGVSTFSGYSSNESSMLSLAMVDVEQSEPGTEVTLVWGEEGGGSAKPVVERHVQTEIRATVAPVPYAEVARTSYRPK